MDGENSLMNMGKITLDILSEIDNLSEGGVSVGDIERAEIAAEAEIEYADGALCLTYTTVENDIPTVTAIKMYRDKAVVTRTGDVVSELVFIEGKATRSVYRVGPYAFDAEVMATRIRNAMTEDGGRIDIFYRMRIGGAEKSVRMKIVSR